MAKLVVSFPPGSTTPHDLPEEQITIGRVEDNTIQIEDASVSSHHAELTPESDGYHLRDLGSTNGTRVNDEEVTEATIHNGDKVRFGQIEATFHADASAAGEAPMPEVGEVESKPAETSARPEDFANASPFAKKGIARDTPGMAVIGLAAVSILTFAAAAVMILTMQSRV